MTAAEIKQAVDTAKDIIGHSSVPALMTPTAYETCLVRWTEATVFVSRALLEVYREPVEIHIRHAQDLRGCPSCRYCVATVSNFCPKCGIGIIWVKGQA